jgi:hypothetical protein
MKEDSEYEAWLRDFLPQLFDKDFIMEPGQVRIHYQRAWPGTHSFITEPGQVRIHSSQSLARYAFIHHRASSQRLARYAFIHHKAWPGYAFIHHGALPGTHLFIMEPGQVCIYSSWSVARYACIHHGA